MEIVASSYPIIVWQSFSLLETRTAQTNSMFCLFLCLFMNHPRFEIETLSPCNKQLPRSFNVNVWDSTSKNAKILFWENLPLENRSACCLGHPRRRAFTVQSSRAEKHIRKNEIYPLQIADLLSSFTKERGRAKNYYFPVAGFIFANQIYTPITLLRRFLFVSGIRFRDCNHHQLQNKFHSMIPPASRLQLSSLLSNRITSTE